MYYNAILRKVATPHFCIPGTIKALTFLLEKKLLKVHHNCVCICEISTSVSQRTVSRISQEIIVV